jgi:hypothetical protein
MFAFAAHAVAAGGTTWTCRYTGEVMDECCCPQERQRPNNSTVQHEDCCDVHHRAAPTVAALPDAKRSACGAAPAGHATASCPVLVARVCARAIDSFSVPRLYPSQPLYKALRHLLI